MTRARWLSPLMQLHDSFSYGVADVTGVKPMSAKSFNKRKGTLLPQLRERTDAPPRRMRVGEGPRDAWHANLRHLLASTNGTVVRGFKLFKLAVDPARWRLAGWLAMAHVVVSTVSPSGTTLYVDPNAHPGEIDEYIFVPSSRAHRELTDAQLLSGEWHLGSVVGGPDQLCERFVAHERLQGRTRSVVAASPDALVAKPRVVVRLPPHFAEWFRVNEIRNTPADLAELMGAPIFEWNRADEAEAEIDAIELYAGVIRNREACVDGVRGLKLELKCNEQLLRGELSIDQARRVFFSHFDATYKLYVERCTALGELTTASL